MAQTDVCVCERRMLECVHTETVNANAQPSIIIHCDHIWHFCQPKHLSTTQKPETTRILQQLHRNTLVLWRTKQRKTVHFWHFQSIFSTCHNISLKVVFFLNGKHETLHCIHILAASAFLYVCISMVYTEFLYFIITCYVSIHVFFYVNFGISHKNTLNGNRMMCIIS